MKVEKDYEEFLRLLNKNRVKYCIVGAYAVAFYAKPRYTKDIDILVEPSPQNAEKIMAALTDFGFGSLAIAAGDFTTEGNIIQLGYEPLRIDILTSLEGLRFKDIWKNKAIGSYGAENVYFIGLDELIESKYKASRPTDRVDLELLERIKTK
jgi:hypothetical protein